MAPNPNESDKCPYSGNTEHYPPVAPIPASRLSRKSSKVRMTSGNSSGLTVPPNLPSRCTWKPNAKNSPHTVDPRYVKGVTDIIQRKTYKFTPCNFSVRVLSYLWSYLDLVSEISEKIVNMKRHALFYVFERFTRFTLTENK